jgi:hypothetical protein
MYKIKGDNMKNLNSQLATRNSQLIFILLFLLTAVLCPLSAVYADLRDNLSDVIAYPNPVRTSIGHNQVTFDNLTSNFTIKIFKINGSVVRQISANDTTGTAIWDLTNDSGEKVGSAVYIYLITNSAGQKFKSKIAIIR